MKGEKARRGKNRLQMIALPNETLHLLLSGRARRQKLLPPHSKFSPQAIRKEECHLCRIDAEAEMHHALHREERALWLRDEVIKLHLRIKKSVGGAIGPGLETLKKQNEKTLLYNGNDISTGKTTD